MQESRWEAGPNTPDDGPQRTLEDVPECASGGAPVPPVVEGWEAVRRLARGGQAEIWLVRAEDGRELVLKVAGPGQDPSAVAAEAAAYGHLSHPHLLRVLGLVDTDRGPGVLSERLPAGSVASLVRQAGPLTPAQAVTVLVPVAQALAHLHEHGVVHGDVTPANVLFAVDGRPALADLGVARVVGGPQGSGGSPGFLAPEQLGPDGQPRMETDGGAGQTEPLAGEDPAFGAAADVYGWAALGWFALTGRVPAASAGRAPLPMLVPDVPVELALLLEAGLDADPAARPSAAEAARAAYAAVEPEPVPLHHGAPSEVAHLLPTAVPHRGRAGTGRRGSGRWGTGRGGRGHGGDARGGWDRTGRGPSPRARLAALGGAATVVGAVALGAALTGGGPEPAGGEAPVAEAPGHEEPPGNEEAPGLESTSETPSAPEPEGSPATSAGPGPSGQTGPSAETAPSGEVRASDSVAGDAELTAELERLAAARTAALRDPDSAHVDAYAAKGTPAWERDRQVQRELTEGDYRFDGLEIRLDPDGEPTPADHGGLHVPARLTTSAHRLLDARGRTADEVPESLEAVTLELVPAADGTWAVADVRPR
ncbi:serine/threonine-protein kinase [Micrococcus sp.]|uniref:serine/threonine-protein kinase n=1 Tax=Micrococcus sp. TaxID=1271 RepID=UPI002A90E2B9|nr:protein kinase [Micrococcus sp.]MDY6055536.1 protein kinase [Micrococcus sp.]